MSKKWTYYNDNDPQVCAWARELIKAGAVPDGEVDSRSITLIAPEDVREFKVCHFFCGILGWAYALKLADWPSDRDVWTGSCPCQKSSSAARGRNTATEWWPPFCRLIAERRPHTVFGEQVVRRRWVDRAIADLQRLDYSIGAAILPALCVGQDHQRERFYFVGHTDRDCESSVPNDAEVARLSRGRSNTGSVGTPNGLSRRMVALSGFGNAIVPQVAEAFIRAYLEC